MPSGYDSIPGGNAGTSFIKKNRTKIIAAILVFILLVSILVVIIITVTDSEGDNDNPPYVPGDIAKAIDVQDIFAHLQKFQEIADESSGSRTATTGYNASAQYVIETLIQRTDFNVTSQFFIISNYVINESPSLRIVSDTPYIYGTDFINIRYGGSGNVTGILQNAGTGCTAADFTNFTVGNVALIFRADLNCTMQTKLTNANNAGAIAVLMYADPWISGLFQSGLESMIFPNLPTFSITNKFGLLLLDTISANLNFELFSNNSVQDVVSYNIIAETKYGSPDDVIVVGSHLDSVPPGPGINDNGSGSATNLELALLWYDFNLQQKNKVRFCWWAGEELGLLGSIHYVNDLKNNNPTEFGKLAANLNYDMLASPNYFIGVYNGSGATKEEWIPIKNGSSVIQKIYENYFDSESIPHQPTPFNGRSDYGPFIDNGIPAGGLFTGAEQRKTIEEQKIYGGLTNAEYDPCYHKFCDNINNINLEALKQTSSGAAFVLETLAFDQNLRDNLKFGNIPPPFE